MKRLLILVLGLWAIGNGLLAEIITMDLSTATDMGERAVAYSAVAGECAYDITDVWDSTYNDSGMCQFIYTNGARFMLSHMPSQNSYGGGSWEGFTLSKVSQDTANVFGCAANGGIGGEGTPYVIGYYSDWVSKTQGYSSNIILFDQEYYPKYVYICQNSNTKEAITNGGIFNARAFTEKDTLALIISGLNSNQEEKGCTVYYLAVDGKMNDGWVKVPLNVLGKTSGLSFRMTTTDMGEWGANTPMYFALDGLTVNTEEPTALPQVDTQRPKEKKILTQQQIYILRGDEWYTPLGQRIR